MTGNLIKSPILVFFMTALSTAGFMPSAQAEEPDFSCVQNRVLPKAQVSKNYLEYDIVLENSCFEPVYWSMCIERMNPWTNEILETLTPSAWVDKDKKFRINLQMKRQEEESREAFENFYVNLVYDLHAPPTVECFAFACEKKKRALRAEWRSNDKALEKVRTAMSDRISAECTKVGWSQREKDLCQTGIARDYRTELSKLGVAQVAINEKLAAVDPEQCRIYPSD